MKHQAGPSPQRRATRRLTLPAGAAAVVLASITGCSGQATTFSGGGGGGGDDEGGNKTLSVSVVAGWDECVAVSHLWKAMLADRGYTLNLQELDIASTFAGVADGQIDMYLDAWLPVTHEVYWKRFSNRLEVLNTWTKGENLLAVPEYVNIDSLAQLKSASNEFDGRIVGIEAGAGLMRATRTQVMPKYGLSNYQLIEGSTAAMLASLDRAIKTKRPMVVTLWRPHWAFSKYPLKVLKDPQGAFGKPDDVQAVATKGFSEENPELATWMKDFKLTNEQLSSLLLMMRDAGKGNEAKAAQDWMAKNKAAVDGWFSGSSS